MLGDDKMKVAILTMFNGLSNTYSLVHIVSEQIKMLLADHMDVRLLVTEHCKYEERWGIFLDPRIEWIPIINSENGDIFHWKTYTRAEDTIEPGFFHQVEIIKQDYVKYLQDIEVCIMHDILYQGVHLIHNVAIREAQKFLPKVKFLAFTHSAPSIHLEATYPMNCMFSEMPHTKFVYPTKCGLDALSKQYNTQLSNCACVHNSLDILIGMNQETRQICSRIDLYGSDIFIVCPGRLTMGKKFHIVAQLAGYISQYCNQKVAVVFCDFSCSDIDPRLYKQIIKDYGIKHGLKESDIIFTSDVGFPNGVRRETVLELFTLSNLFVCPSFSESFGLTVIEAASRGNYIVLNEAVPALAEIGQQIGAYFMRWDAKNFGYDTYEQYHPSEALYFIDQAQQIVRNMEQDSVLQAKTRIRTQYSNQWIYEHQLKILL